MKWKYLIKLFLNPETKFHIKKGNIMLPSEIYTNIIMNKTV